MSFAKTFLNLASWCRAQRGRPTRSLQSFRRRVGNYIEVLEERTLLADNIFGSSLFVITHGFQLPGTELPPWVFDMAIAINSRMPETDQCSLREIELSEVGLVSGPDPGHCKYFLLFNWRELSFLDSPGTANDDRVAGRLAGVIHEELVADTSRDLHTIGHSRGSFVNTDVIRRLAAMGDGEHIGFLQMTTLDPQDFNLIDTDGILEANPGGIVDWADNFYRTGVPILDGEPIDGALNVNLTNILNAWEGRTDFEFIPGQNEHTEVHDWYHWTIDTSNNVDNYQDVPNPDRNAMYPDPTWNDDWNNGATVGFYWAAVTVSPQWHGFFDALSDQALLIMNLGLSDQYFETIMRISGFPLGIDPTQPGIVGLPPAGDPVSTNTAAATSANPATEASPSEGGAARSILPSADNSGAPLGLQDVPADRIAENEATLSLPASDALVNTEMINAVPARPVSDASGSTLSSGTPAAVGASDVDSVKLTDIVVEAQVLTAPTNVPIALVAEMSSATGVEAALSPTADVAGDLSLPSLVFSTQDTTTTTIDKLELVPNAPILADAPPMPIGDDTSSVAAESTDMKESGNVSSATSTNASPQADLPATVILEQTRTIGVGTESMAPPPEDDARTLTSTVAPTVVKNPAPPAVAKVELVVDAKRKLTQISVVFSDELEGAENLRYALTWSTGKRVKSIALSPRYGPASGVAILTPPKPLSGKLLSGATLTISGSPGLTVLSNTSFDGDQDGRPGGDYVRLLSAATSFSSVDRNRVVDSLLESGQLSASIRLD